MRSVSRGSERISRDLSQYIGGVRPVRQGSEVGKSWK